MQKTFNTKKFLSQNSIWLVLIVLVIIMNGTRPVRSLIGSFASSPPSSLFPQASSICQATALEGLCLRGKGGHGIVSLIGKSPRYPS